MLSKKEFIPLNDDLIFKEAFCHKDNRKQLIHFLKSTLHLDEDIIKKDLKVFYQSVFDKERKDTNLFRGNIIIIFNDYIINLENYSHFDKNCLRRSMTYFMDLFSTMFENEEEKDNLKKVIQINVVKNVEDEEFDKYSEEYIISDRNNNRIMPEHFRVKYYTADKIEKEENNNDDELRWIKFISAESKEERIEIAKGDELLMEMNNWLEEFTNNEYNIKRYGEWSEWLAEEKGKKIAIKEIARKMKEKEIPLQLIAEITGLTNKEIEKMGD